jgi:F-type H+-transporting ATPase subunit gamma
MTRRQNLEHHRNSLAEIRNILNSMKTLAYMETRKLASRLDAQATVVDSIEEVASDFLEFNVGILPEMTEPHAVYVLVGTERGFCGDFNHAVLHHMETTLASSVSKNPALVVIGHKLNALLEYDERVKARIEGASVVEAVEAVLSNLIETLIDLQDEYGEVSVYCLYQGPQGGVTMQKLLPPFQHLLQNKNQYPCAPEIYLTPQEFLLELTEHYLFASFYEILYGSLMAENHHRITHLDGAVRHLDEESENLVRKSNMLRQEEIIEEIEVILLSAKSLGVESD